MADDDTPIRNLRNLGPKSEQMLKAAGVCTRGDIRRLGPIETYLRVQDQTGDSASLNLLHAMVGALSDRHWTRLDEEEKGRLLAESDGWV